MIHGATEASAKQAHEPLLRCFDYYRRHRAHSRVCGHAIERESSDEFGRGVRKP